MKRKTFRSMLILALSLVLIGCGGLVACVTETHTHSYGEWEITKKATCKEVGSRKQACSCGDTKVEEIAIDSTAHSYGDWTTENATCTEPGSREQVCALCAKTVTEDIAATGHTYGDWTITKNPTCTKAGSHEKVCSCGDTVVEPIAATGHTYGEWEITKKATCKEPGSRKQVCLCGDAKVEEIAIDPNAHDFSNGACARCGNLGDVSFVNAINKFLKANDLNGLITAEQKDGTLSLCLNADAINSQNPIFGDGGLDGLMTELFGYIDGLFAGYTDKSVTVGDSIIFDNGGINNTGLKNALVSLANGGFYTLANMKEVNGKYVYKTVGVGVIADDFVWNTSLSIELKGDDVNKVIALANTIEKHIAMETMSPQEIKDKYGIDINGEADVQVLTLETPDALLNALKSVLEEMNLNLTLDDVKDKFNTTSVEMLLGAMAALDLENVFGSGADGILSIINTINSNANLVNKILTKLNIQLGDIQLFKDDAKFEPTVGENSWEKFVNGIKKMMSDDALAATPGQFLVDLGDGSSHYAMPLTMDISVAGFKATETVLVVLHMPFEKVFCNHSYDEGQITQDPTCTTVGIKEYPCYYCNDTKVEEIAIDPNAHEMDNKNVCEHCLVLGGSEGKIFAVRDKVNTYRMSAQASQYGGHKYWALILGENGNGGTLIVDNLKPYEDFFRSITIESDYQIYHGTLVIGKLVKIAVTDENMGAGENKWAETGVISEKPVTTLTVNKGANITIEDGGALLVNATVLSKQPTTGRAMTFGQINLEGTITVRGSLYSRGYILGTGKITAEDGAKVKTLLVVNDYRGGTYTLKKKGDCLPFNSYDMNNIQVSTDYKYGSSLSAVAKLSGGGAAAGIEAPIIGIDAKSMFQQTHGSIVNVACIEELGAPGNVAYSKLDITLYGTNAINNISLKISGMQVGTEGLYLPFYGNVTLEKDSVLNILCNFKLLPGAKITIKEGAVANGITAGDKVPKMLAYGKDEWKKEFYYTAVSKRPLVDATIICEGTMNNIDLYYSSKEMTNQVTVKGSTVSIVEGGKLTIIEPAMPGKVELIDSYFYKLAVTPIN